MLKLPLIPALFSLRILHYNVWNLHCRASNAHFFFSLLSFISTLQNHLPWKRFSVITCGYLSIYQKPHTMIIKSSSAPGHRLMPLQCLCITMICWHMLKQAGGLLEENHCLEHFLYIFVVPPSFSALSIASQAGKSSSQGWQYSINTIFVLISRENTRRRQKLHQQEENIQIFLHVNKAPNDWEKHPCIWKTAVMRPFGGDAFMYGCNFDSTSDPSLWQFYK